MEILHNLWNVVSTEDENLTKYVVILLGLIESYVTLKFFTTILNISYTKKQKNIYILVMELFVVLSTLFIPRQFSIFFHLIAIFLVIKFVFKTSVTKSILAELLPMLVIILIESTYVKIYLLLFNKTYIDYQYIIIYRIPTMLIIYLTMFLLTIFIKSLKKNFSIFEHIDSYRKKLLLINLIFIIILIAIQFYLIIFYNKVLPVYITMISLFTLITYSIVSIYSIIKTVNLEITKNNLEQSELHNKSLELLYNNVSAFKHDFSNIITALGGFIYSKNLDGLEKYYNKIIDECHINNNLSTLNPKVINNPAVYNILASKYYKADELGINIDLQFFINLDELKVDIYDFCRILGILFDNAIEASSQCDKKQINIDFRDLKIRKCQTISIENTYINKNVDISKMTEKGYTTKENDSNQHGIGLWQVAKLIKKHNNLILETTKNEEYFKQELVIYY